MKRLLTLAFVLLAGSPAIAQEGPQTFNAFAVATAQGTIVPAGEKKAVLVGTVSGPFFVETDEGPVEAGHVSCAASLRLDHDTRRQTGSGACTFTAPDGATAWGEWSCEGYDLVGCRGKLVLSGGSARLKGVSGEGAMTWRPSVRELNRQIDGSTEITASGVLIWRDFKLTQK